MSGDVTTNDLVALEAEVAKLRAEVERLSVRPIVDSRAIENYRRARAKARRLRADNEAAAKSFGNTAGSYRTPLTVIEAVRLEIAAACVLADAVTDGGK